MQNRTFSGIHPVLANRVRRMCSVSGNARPFLLGALRGSTIRPPSEGSDLRREARLESACVVELGEDSVQSWRLFETDAQLIGFVFPGGLYITSRHDI